MGEATEKHGAFGALTGVLKKVRVTWEGDGVYGLS
jgi:hypothetical protein